MTPERRGLTALSRPLPMRIVTHCWLRALAQHPTAGFMLHKLAAEQGDPEGQLRTALCYLGSEALLDARMPTVKRILTTGSHRWFPPSRPYRRGCRDAPESTRGADIVCRSCAERCVEALVISLPAEPLLMPLPHANAVGRSWSQSIRWRTTTWASCTTTAWRSRRRATLLPTYGSMRWWPRRCMPLTPAATLW